MLLITLSRWHRWAHSFDTAHDRLQTETRRFFCLHGFTAVRLFSQLCQVTGYFNKGNKSSGVDWSGLITCSCNIAWVHPWARFSINPMTRSAQPLFWACQEGGKWVDDGHLLLERHWDQLQSPQPPAILHPLTHASYSGTKNESCHSQLLPQPRPLLTSARHWDSIPNIGQQPDGIMEQSSICDVLTNRLKQMKETEFCRFYLWIKDCTFVSYPCPCYSYFKRSAEIPIRNKTHKLRSQKKSREAELSFKGAVCCLPCLPALS